LRLSIGPDQAENGLAGVNPPLEFDEADEPDPTAGEFA
jgi:hypothetical protein